MTIPILLLILGLAQDKPQAKAAMQELTFAWPETLSATVESERKKEQKRGDAPATITEVKVRHRMRALPHPKGRLIQYDEYTILDDSIDKQSAEEFGQVIAAMMPNLIVGSDGRLVGIENIEALKAMLDQLVASAKKEAAKGAPEMQQMLDALTSKPFLTALAGQEWQALIQAWLGLPVSAEVTRFENEQPFPLAQGVTLTLRGSAQMVSQQDCTRGGVTLACATFEMTSSTDPKSIQDLFARMFKNDKSFQEVKFDRFEMTNVVRVTLETATMVPHAWSLNKSVIMAATGPKGERFDASQKEARTMKFTYAQK